MPKAVYLRSLTLDFQLSPSNSSLKSSTLPCRALLGFFMITKPGGTVITNKFECAGLLLDRINKFIWVMDWKQVWGCPFKRTLLERGKKIPTNTKGCMLAYIHYCQSSWFSPSRPDQNFKLQLRSIEPYFHTLPQLLEWKRDTL